MVRFGLQVTIIKQGYLTKRSQGKGRHDWKRRFFVLDSTGMMYYYSHKVREQGGVQASVLRVLLVNQHVHWCFSGPTVKPLTCLLVLHACCTATHHLGRGSLCQKGISVGFAWRDMFTTMTKFHIAISCLQAADGNVLGGLSSRGTSRPKNTLPLLTSTVKMDAEDPGMRCCFRYGSVSDVACVACRHTTIPGPSHVE